MVLAEVLTELFNIKYKMSQLEHYLCRVSSIDASMSDEATTKLLDLMDKHRSHLMMINKLNNSTEVTIGKTEVSLADALLIANTMKRKIDLLNTLINNKDCKLDVLSLMAQRDKLLNEYTAISSGLKIVEWGTEVD